MATSPPHPPDRPAPAAQHASAGLLASWIEDLLQKSAGPHAASLLKVSGELGLRAYSREAERLHEALRALSDDLADVDYGLVTHPDGTPHNPPDLQGFVPLYRAVTIALEPVEALTGELEAWLQAHGEDVKLAQADLRTEQERLEVALKHGDGWLAAVWADLKARRPVPGDRAAIDDLRRLAKTADVLGSRLRGLHSAGRAARDASDSADNVVSARAALVRMLRDDLRRTRDNWAAAVDWMLAVAREGQVNRLPVQPVAQAEMELRTLLDRCSTECARLRQDQRGLQRSLATACEQLRAAMQPTPPAAPPRSGGASRR